MTNSCATVLFHTDSKRNIPYLLSITSQKYFFVYQYFLSSPEKYEHPHFVICFSFNYYYFSELLSIAEPKQRISPESSHFKILLQTFILTLQMLNQGYRGWELVC